MTSTSVKDVSTVLQSVKTNAGASVQSAKDGGFQAVFDKHTNQNRPDEASKTEQKQKSVDRPAQATKTGEASDRRSAEKFKRSEEPDKDLEEADGRTVENVMEVLQAGAAELITQIAGTLGISEEDVTRLMDDMGLEALDLLQSGKLSELLLTAAKAEDSTALLTDEGLYRDFQTIMNAQNDILAESAKTLQTDVEQLQELMLEAQSVVTGEAPEEVLQGTDERLPVIEVEISDEPVAEQQSKEIRTDGRYVAESDAQNQETKASGEAAKPDRGSRHSQNNTGGQHQSGNIMLQQIKEDAFNMQTGQVNESAFAGDMETQDIMRQIMDYMKIQIKPDMSSLEMQLHPASLGTLQVQVASKGGVLTAQFITQNEAVKAALESQMVQLQESFAEQGVKVEAIEVTVQTHQFEQNLEQGRERHQEASERKSRNRRVRLERSLAVEGMEEQGQEEQLAAQMMSASGTTVDYTV